MEVVKTELNPYGCVGCGSEGEFEINLGDYTIVLCRKCLLRLKRQIDDVVEKR